MHEDIFPLSTLMKVFLGTLIVVGYLVSPTVLIWGWIRWAKLPKLRTAPSILSFAGFILATSSALLAISSIAYSVVIRHFPYYDPLLMRIYAWGILLSLGGIVFGIGGVWRPKFASLARARFRSVHADILDNDGINGMSPGAAKNAAVRTPRP